LDSGAEADAARVWQGSAQMDGSVFPDDEIWKTLGIRETTSLPAIKRAYAERLKACRPEIDPEGFQRLRWAFEAARSYAGTGAAPRPGPAQAFSGGADPAAGMPHGRRPHNDESPADAPQTQTFRPWNIPPDGGHETPAGDAGGRTVTFEYPLFETDPADLPPHITGPIDRFLDSMGPVLHAGLDDPAFQVVTPGYQTWLNILRKANFESKEIQEWAGFALFSVMLQRMEESASFFGQCKDLDGEVWREMDKMFGWSLQEIAYGEHFAEAEWTDHIFHWIAKAWGKEGQESLNRTNWAFWVFLAPILAPLGFIYFFFKLLFQCMFGGGARK
jgi:hypothetical protein